MDPNTPSAIQLASGGMQSVPPPVMPAPKPQPVTTPQSPVSDLKVAPTAPISSPVAAPTAPVSTEKPFTTPNTGVVQNPNTGLYEAYANGQRISTGTQSAAQSALDKKVNSIRSGESTVTTPVATDSTTVANEEKSLLEQYKSIVTEPALDTRYIDNELTALEARQQAEIANINSTFDSLKVTQGEQQKSETGTTSAALARAGGYLGNSGSGTGVLLNLAQSHRAEVQALEAKRQQAIGEARAAFQDKQFALVRQKVDLAREYQKEMKNRQIDYFNLVKEETEKQKKIEDSKRLSDVNSARESSIVGLIGQGYTEPTELYNALNFSKNGEKIGDISVEEISNVIDKFKPKNSESASFKPSSAQITQLLGAGFGKQDIQTITDSINTSGYTSELTSGMSAYQKRVLDNMFLLKPEKVTAAKDVKIDYVPDTLKSVVSLRGVGNTFGDLQGDTPPQWFLPFLQEVGNELSMSVDPSSSLAKEVWSSFKSHPEIDSFKKQVNRKLYGSIDAGLDYGAYTSNIPASTDLSE